MGIIVIGEIGLCSNNWIKIEHHKIIENGMNRHREIVPFAVKVGPQTKQQSNSMGERTGSGIVPDNRVTGPNPLMSRLSKDQPQRRMSAPTPSSKPVKYLK